MIAIIILAVLGLFCMISGLFNPNNKVIFSIVSIVTLACFGIITAQLTGCDPMGFHQGLSFEHDMLLFDKYALAFTGLLLLSALLVFGLAENSLKDIESYVTERYALMIFALTGGITMVAYDNMATLFIGLEVLSVSLYILAGSNKESLASNEACLKYFLMGAFSTGILLMGITLIYGATGSFYLDEIGSYLQQEGAAGEPLVITGILLLLVSMAFKVSVAPFHFWTADVYQGSPTFVTTFMASVVKIAGFGAFFRLFYMCFLPVNEIWLNAIWVLAAITMFIGGITAVSQHNVKRLLAFSSVTHAGYMLMAVLLAQHNAGNTMLFYSAAYAIATVASFGVLMLVQKSTGKDDLSAFHGLSKSNPFLAFVMTLALCSLAGFPLTGGFFAKFYIIKSGFQAEYNWLVIILIINAIIGIYYYFKIIIAMYFKDQEADHVLSINTGAMYKTVLILTSLLTLQMGIFPEWVYGLF